MSGDWKDRLRQMDTDLNPPSPGAKLARLVNQADFLLQSGRYSQAADLAREAIATSPDDPRPYAQMSMALAHLKDSSAHEWARKAIERDPQNGRWHAVLSDSYNLLGDWEEGLEHMRRAVELSPESPMLNSALGICLYNNRRSKEALPYLERAVEKNPANATYRLRLGVCMRRVGDNDGAETHIRKALELDPASAEIQTALGNFLLSKRKYAEADVAFREALRLNPRFTGAKVGLGAPMGERVDPLMALARLSLRIVAIPKWTRFALYVLQLVAWLVLLTLTASSGWPAGVLDLGVWGFRVV